MYIILSALTRLIAPMLSFTAEEIWKAMPHVASDVKESIFLNPMPEVNAEYEFDGEDRWNKLFDLRDSVMKGLEIARADKLIGKSLDAKLTIYAKGEAYKTLADFADELKTVFIVSGVTLLDTDAPADAFCEEESEIAVKVEAADGEKCDRCWAYFTDCETTEDGHICPRCKKIVESL